MTEEERYNDEPAISDYFEMSDEEFNDRRHMCKLLGATINNDKDFDRFSNLGKLLDIGEV